MEKEEINGQSAREIKQEMDICLDGIFLSFSFYR